MSCAQDPHDAAAAFVRDDAYLSRFRMCDGPTLHQRVPPSRWCVTREDLRQFRRLVSRAVEQGWVTPPGSQGTCGPGHVDLVVRQLSQIGPSIGVVTRQLISPVTQQRGGASWALTLHPKGLPCDLFVTHCWSEGVFEFIDKVLHSWPRGARHAYCCMLSNPQNLDISSLISAPEHSPFAQALRSARCTLVVPNAACSIYTRIWCVYEAYLSYSWNKPIFTATKPDFRALCWYVGSAIALGLSSTFLTFLLFRLGWLELNDLLNVAAIGLIGMCGSATLMMKPSEAVRKANDLGSALCGFMVGYCLEAFFRSWRSSMFQLFPAEASAMMFTLTGLMFSLCEADRLWDTSAAREAVQLCSGYTGSLHDAQSSVAVDRERILLEIQEKQLEDSVEQAIDVLIRAGMSTPALRRAASRGVDVSGAGRWSFAMVHAVCIIFVYHPLCHILFDLSCTGTWAWVPWVTTLEGVAWVLLFKFRGQDHRSLMASSGIFLGAIPYFTVWFFATAALLAEGKLHRHATCLPDKVGVLAWGPLVLLTAALGVDGCAAVPVIGPMLVRLLLRNRTVRPPTLSGASDSEESDKAEEQDHDSSLSQSSNSGTE